RYVGSAVCAECHQERHQSYLLTSHSRALSELDPKAEPPDGEFIHQASGRSYRVFRRNGELRHEEVQHAPDGLEIAKVDLPVRYLVGSGHFTRSYLVEVDGYLYESPITWYASKKKWDVSPGYDRPRNLSFERPVDTSCLFCHAGRVEAVPETAQPVTLHEKAIGCESCHGPGSLHRELRRNQKQAGSSEDLSIVNPGKLARSQLEDICANCHLSAAVMIPLRGRRFTDYRPGMPLTDYRIDYRFDGGSEEMTVVGHVEQLRKSICYQKSELTCLNCHDLHAKEPPKDRVAFYRSKCLDCHADKGCKLERTRRLEKEPADNCAACHMPRGDTDIPHVAFTHHRIGLHATQPRTESVGAPNLVPIQDTSHLSSVEQQRNLGLAYLGVSGNQNHSKHSAVFVKRGRDLLQAARAAGLRDPIAAQALADVYFNEKRDLTSAMALARDVIEAVDSPPEARVRAGYLLAVAEMRENQFASAGLRLGEVTRMRRDANDWLCLAGCSLKLNQPSKGIQALETALQIQPYRPDLHAQLAYINDQLGFRKLAEEHRRKAQWLASHGKE
ncbi:MAG TPA: multiheme c-type cytochrome, partial [Gemmataceae bacterium]|nr:multiheme c-type cytochrome [Gemmataceae bacterium]